MVLKASVALFWHNRNVWGPRGRAVKVLASWHDEVTSFTITPPIPHQLQQHHVHRDTSLPIVVSGLKNIFPRKRTRKNTLRVFRPVDTVFERDNFDYNVPNFDYTALIAEKTISLILKVKFL